MGMIPVGLLVAGVSLLWVLLVQQNLKARRAEIAALTASGTETDRRQHRAVVWQYNQLVLKQPTRMVARLFGFGAIGPPEGGGAV